MASILLYQYGIYYFFWPNNLPSMDSSLSSSLLLPLFEHSICYIRQQQTQNFVYFRFYRYQMNTRLKQYERIRGVDFHLVVFGVCGYKQSVQFKTKTICLNNPFRVRGQIVIFTSFTDCGSTLRSFHYRNIFTVPVVSSATNLSYIDDGCHLCTEE